MRKWANYGALYTVFFFFRSAPTFSNLTVMLNAEEPIYLLNSVLKCTVWPNISGMGFYAMFIRLMLFGSEIKNIPRTCSYSHSFHWSTNVSNVPANGNFRINTRSFISQLVMGL